LNGGAESAPGGRIVGDPTRYAPEQRRAAAGLACQGVGLYAPREQDFFEARQVPAELGERAPGVEPSETPEEQFLG
jgi:hypothetical protein